VALPGNETISVRAQISVTFFSFNNSNTRFVCSIDDGFTLTFAYFHGQITIMTPLLLEKSFLAHQNRAQTALTRPTNVTHKRNSFFFCVVRGLR